jgi:histidine ammonia-lyase
MNTSLSIQFDPWLLIRRDAAYYDKDRYFAPDLAKAAQWVGDNAFKAVVPRERLVP